MAQRLRAAAPAGRRVDRAGRRLIGFVAAEEGAFASGRGRFTRESLERIVRLWPLAGLKVRFGHPGLFDDGPGKHLGRAVNPRLDGGRVRADLHLDPTAFTSPEGNLGQYVLDLAASDPLALGASLMLSTEERADGLGGPPAWLPRKLWGCDVVEEPDATHYGLFGPPAGSLLSRRPLSPTVAARRGRLPGPTGALRRRLEEKARRLPRPAGGGGTGTGETSNG